MGKKANYITKIPVDPTIDPDDPDETRKQKEVGDPVLDLPIRFTVDVTEWDDVWSKEDDENHDGQDIEMN